MPRIHLNILLLFALDVSILIATKARFETLRYIFERYNLDLENLIVLIRTQENNMPTKSVD